jgi:hypothetical protein
MDQTFLDKLKRTLKRVSPIGYIIIIYLVSLVYYLLRCWSAKSENDLLNVTYYGIGAIISALLFSLFTVIWFIHKYQRKKY